MATTDLERTPRPPLLHRASPRQLQRVDFAIALLVCALAVLYTLGSPSGARIGHRGHDLRPSIAWVLAAASVALRRRSPTLALALVTASTVVAFDSAASGIPDLLVAFPIYQIAATRPRRQSFMILGGEVAVLSALALAGALDARGDSSADFVVAIAAWFVGDSVRVRRVYVAGLAEQAALKQREILQRAERSVTEERLQIARELHDVVAHSLSVIAVQSGVGRHVIDTNPVEAKAALAAVEATSRSALDELRRMLGVLRRDDETPPSLIPAPGIAALPGLVEQVRAAGTRVDLSIDRSVVDSLSPSAELSVFRIVQEALTNVVKHAGPSSAIVSVRGEGNALLVEITDNGHGRQAPIGTNAEEASEHHGIVGMRERVGLFGGTLSAGSRAAEGFTVLATLPLDRIGSS